MKRILRALLLIVVVLGAAYFLLIDHILKAVIESEGSKALTAKLDVSGVTFHIVPLSIRLHGVQVTNPQQPTRNLVEFAELATPLQLSAIRERKIDIPELRIQGLRFNTTRAQTGAIAGLTPTGSAVDSAPGLPDSAQIALQQQQRLRDEVSKTQADLKAILGKWQQRFQQLPDDSRIEEYRQRAMELRAANKNAELAQLRQQLTGELSSARQLADDFELDMQSARAQFAYAQAAPQSGGNFSATPQAMNNIVGALLGAEFQPVLATLAQQINRVVAQQSAGANAAQPALLIRRATIDGQLDLGAQPLLFTGTIDNFTPQPRLWNVATEFALAGVPAQASQFSARGRADFRKTASIDMRFDLRQFPLRDFPLSKNSQLGIGIETATADMQGLLSATGNQIDVNLLSRFQQATLNVQAATDSAAQTLKTALHGVTEFDLNLQVSGDIQKPTMKFDSSLTPRLAAALSQQLHANGEAQADNMSPEVRQQLGGIAQLATDFENLRRQVLARQAALQSIFGP